MLKASKSFEICYAESILFSGESSYNGERNNSEKSFCLSLLQFQNYECNLCASFEQIN